MSSNVLTSRRCILTCQFPDDKFERITFKSNDLNQTFFCTGILSILKPDVMATKEYSFQDDEKTIIDIDIDTVAEKEKNEWMRKLMEV